MLCLVIKNANNNFSFALHPEEHQPSGIANLSRLENEEIRFYNQSAHFFRLFRHVDPGFVLPYNIR